MIKANILLCGKSGVGKTSLIQALTAYGTVPDEAIGHGKATTTGFDVYETEAVNYIDSEGMEIGETVEEFASNIMDEVISRLSSEKAENLIHNIWYCVDGSGARVQSADAKLISRFSDKVLLIVTKADSMRKEQIKPFMASVQKLLPRDRIVVVSSIDESGLQQLLAKSKEICERAIQSADQEIEGFRSRWDEYFRAKLEHWEARNDEDSNELINWAAGRAAAIALIPLPLADVGPLMANEAYMIYKLGAVYGYAVDESIFTMLAGVAGGSIAGKLAASFLPFLKVPIAAGITYAVGKAAKAYFESDMTLLAESIKEKFLEAEKEAKDVDWKEQSVEE